MDSVTLKDFRCFRGEQTARMAPLTLLVGENSTGKTSFLAILRALWEVAVNEVVPDFRREPYDLGAFSEIVYNDSSRGDQRDAFQAGFRDSASPNCNEAISFRVTFQNVDGEPFPVSRCASVGEVSFGVAARPGQSVDLRLDIEGRTCKVDYAIPVMDASSRRKWLHPVDSAILNVLHFTLLRDVPGYSVRETSEQYEYLSLGKDNLERISEVRQRVGDWRFYQAGEGRIDNVEPFAGAPVRSKPRRTYDPSRLIPDPEGEYVPTYLASLSRQDTDEWNDLKNSLEKFGRNSGLFDEISIESFGRTDDATPFQIQIRKFGRNLKGNRRNLIDVGYGVSQALPLMTELLHPNAPPMFLLQQPEIHLHPSAQAALGSLFCSIAGPDRQLVVETHSDYIIDRVRMDVRDKKTGLKPKDVSILYFEHGDSDVKIHSIGMDEHGNILDAPEGYRQFFADELTRSIGL